MEAGRFKQCIFFVSSNKVCINILKDEGIFQKTTAGYDVLVICFQKISRPPYGYMAIARLKPKRCNIINHPRLLIFWNWTIQNLEHDPISKDNKTTWDIPHLFQDVFFSPISFQIWIYCFQVDHFFGFSLIKIYDYKEHPNHQAKPTASRYLISCLLRLPQEIYEKGRHREDRSIRKNSIFQQGKHTLPGNTKMDTGKWTWPPYLKRIFFGTFPKA